MSDADEHARPRERERAPDQDTDQDDERTVDQDERASDQNERTVDQDERTTDQDERTVHQDERASDQEERTPDQDERGAEDEREQGGGERERAKNQDEREDAQVPDRAPRRRVFFALWPDEPTRAALVRATRRAVRRSGGRPTARHNLHVTVAFLGAISEEALERALHVPPVEVGVFELTLDTLGFQARSRVLWLTAREIPRPLTALERRLWAALVEQGFERERRPYRPHVTLTRRGRAVDEPVKPVTWPARRLALCESVQTEHGVRYQPLQLWPL